MIKKLFEKENREKLLNLIYSIGGIAVYNMVLQFLLYPAFERELGEVKYGVVLSVLSFLAVTAGSVGGATNCARILGVEKGYTENSDYNHLLLLFGVLCSGLGVAYLWSVGLSDMVSVGLYILLSVITMLRYYGDVEFRISTNFFRFMVFYLLLSAGYLVGILVFRATKLWLLALLLGELLAIVYVFVRGTIFRPPFFKKTTTFRPVTVSVVLVVFSYLLDNITAQADRILLLAITGDGEQVTIYYIASIIGRLVVLLVAPIHSLLLSYLIRYSGALTKKLWLSFVGIAGAFTLVAFLGCLGISPLFVRIFYPDNLEQVRPYFVPAILGQCIYFVSSLLLTVLLRFYGEKMQLCFNGAYLTAFFALVSFATATYGLVGFLYAILLINTLRFLAIVLFGFLAKKRRSLPTANAENEEHAQN